MPRKPRDHVVETIATYDRFYTYYTRGELLRHFKGFDVVAEDRIAVARGGFEFWLRKNKDAFQAPEERSVE